MAKKKYCCRACKNIRRFKLEIEKLRAQKKELLCRNKQLDHAIRELKGLVFKTDNRQKNKDLIELLPKKRGAPFGHKGRTRAKPIRIDEEQNVTIEKCPFCGCTNLTECSRYDEHIQEDITIPRIKVTLYRHHLYYCKNCRKVSRD